MFLQILLFIIRQLFLELIICCASSSWRQKGTVEVCSTISSSCEVMLSGIFAVLWVPWIPGVCFSTLLSDKGGILRYISSVESFKKYISNSIKTLPNVFQLKQHFARKSFYCCRLSVNFHCCDKEGLQISTVRPPFLAFRLSRQRLLPTCLSLELLSICSHFWKRKYNYWPGKAGNGRILHPVLWSLHKLPWLVPGKAVQTAIIGAV